MSSIKSRYLNRDFIFEPIIMERSNGLVTIISHNTLYDIIQNQIQDEVKVDCEYEPILVTKAHCFVKCTMKDDRGRKITDFGESTYDSLTTKIAKGIPATMAAIRAYDRVAIRYLNFDCAGKVYSDQEIPENEYKMPPETETMEEEPVSSEGSLSMAESAEPMRQDEKKKKPSKTAKSKAASSPEPGTTQSMITGVWNDSSLRDEILSALENHSELICFDTETTGLKAKEDRIVEIAAQKYAVDNGQLKLIDNLQLYIKSDVPIPDDVSTINGISNEFLEDKPVEEEAFIDVYNFFGENPEILCGYNTGFDVRFLSAMYERQEKRLKPQCILDVCKMAKDQVRTASNYKLETVAGVFGMEGEDFHSAAADVEYTAQLFEIFLEVYRKDNPDDAPVSEPEEAGKQKPRILSIDRFAPSPAVQRIYVNTEAKTVFFDCLKKNWQSKDADMNELDMEYIEQEAWRIAGVSDQDEFADFKGKWSGSQAA